MASNVEVSKLFSEFDLKGTDDLETHDVIGDSWHTNGGSRPKTKLHSLIKPCQ